MRGIVNRLFGRGDSDSDNEKEEDKTKVETRPSRRQQRQPTKPTAPAEPPKPKRTPIYVVSGLPRSGTSLMMQMLRAGGLAVMTDGERSADTDNPNGYLEYERVKQVKNGDTGWLGDAEGKAVKIISAILPNLPDSHDYKILLMRRDLDEVIQSQRTMLGNRDEVVTNDDERLKLLYSKHLRQIDKWVRDHDNVSAVDVQYAQVVGDPTSTIAAVAEFLDRPMDQDAMRQAIDPSLYRNRAGEMDATDDVQVNEEQAVEVGASAESTPTSEPVATIIETREARSGR